MKTIVLLILITLSSCQFNFLQNEIQKIKAAPGEVILTPDCIEGLPIVHKKTRANPPIVQKGETMNLKAAVQSDKKLHIAAYNLVCYLNGAEAFTQNKDLNDDIEEGEMYVYSVDATVPSFIPTGSFDIYVYLVDDNKEKLSCLKAHFDY